ncbi:Eukaryotic translation initiation factor 3 subunit J [Exophiala mesophila]|uniref:Eukaryotic translation initiation factor 3 subunit J n=1 Tax=Exophiala mesophila TaxID=212818 RepID=A0A438NDL7_EXOME|nr:Eukaryotic translation initiation factor 3 subunit J [Exophiala mesophila]
MPPKKWDDESEESSDEESVDVPAARRKFGDEEDSDDVADNWEEEDDSDAEREKAAKAAAAKAKADAEAAANKKSKAQRIEEHREANRRKRLEEDAESDDDEDDTQRRLRLRQTEQDADLKHAQDLFGDVGIGPKGRTNKATIIEDKANPGQAIDLSALALFRPATKTQFDNLTTTLAPLLAASSSRPHYAIWLPTFVKQIAADLPSAEIKKVASALTALSNEKMKEEKSADKGGKKSKAAKTKTSLAAGRDVGRGVADTTSYDDDGLGDDDFM